MPKRIQRKRTKGWKMPANTVYVGRPSKWGNPYKVGELGITSNAEAVARFEDYLCYMNNLNPQANNDKIFLYENIKKELRGKNLACWCKEGEPCHADLLLKIANE